MFMFEFQKNNQTIINKWNGTEEYVFVPSFFGNNKITELAPYCFHNQRELKKISLPRTLNKIGNHCFYDCRSMEIIELWNTTTEIEDGAFKNCTSVKRIEIHFINNKLTCLKNLLAELNQKIEVVFIYEQGETVRLIFPKYIYDYEENTQARIINQITYGTGVHYRECIKEQEIDYKGYDKLFRTAKNLEILDTLEHLIINRLRFPYHMSEESKSEYVDFLIEKREKIAEDLVKKGDRESIQFILQSELRESFSELFLKLGQKYHYVEGIAISLDANKKRSKMKKKKFEL